MERGYVPRRRSDASDQSARRRPMTERRFHEKEGDKREGLHLGIDIIPADKEYIEQRIPSPEETPEIDNDYRLDTDPFLPGIQRERERAPIKKGSHMLEKRESENDLEAERWENNKAQERKRTAQPGSSWIDENVWEDEW